MSVFHSLHRNGWETRQTLQCYLPESVLWKHLSRTWHCQVFNVSENQIRIERNSGHCSKTRMQNCWSYFNRSGNEMISHFLWETSSEFTPYSDWKLNYNCVAQRCFIITLLFSLLSSAASSSPHEFIGRIDATRAIPDYTSWEACFHTKISSDCVWYEIGYFCDFTRCHVFNM